MIFGALLAAEVHLLTILLVAVGMGAALAAVAWLRSGEARQFPQQAERGAARGNVQFLASMAHDIRNPVATIVSAMDLLSDAPDVGPSSREIVDAVNRSARHLSSLVLDHLDSARLEAGAIEVSPRAVRIDVLLREVCRELAPEADDKQVELSVEYAPGAFVAVDPSSAVRVLSNVLAHSIQLTASSGRIELSADVEGPELVLRIERGGVAVGAEEERRLFERDRHLDLYIAKRLAEANGGSVYLCPDSPTAFAVVLPLSLAQTAAA